MGTVDFISLGPPAWPDPCCLKKLCCWAVYVVVHGPGKPLISLLRGAAATGVPSEVKSTDTHLIHPYSSL